MSPAPNDARLHFAPWLRTGAAASLANADPLTGSLPTGGALAPWVQISGRRLPEEPVPAALLGPGHVLGLQPRSVGHVEPPDGSTNVEWNYFPYLELHPADLPWRFTPAAPGERDQLRPWVVLVVVEQRAGVRLAKEPGAPLPVLGIDPAAGALPSRELPDLADSAAWAHVQSTLPPERLDATLAADPSVATARLICPRRLAPASAWHACLVPAFDLGRRAGLGEAVAGAAQALPAWRLDDPALDRELLRLPVYFSWSFSTGSGGDFEALARRLRPHADARLGRATLDLSAPGWPLSRAAEGSPLAGRFVGALRSPGVTRGGVPPAQRARIEKELTPVLNRGAARPTVSVTAPPDYDPLRDDPVVAPPLYGSLQARRFDLPRAGDVDDGGPADPRAWMRPLNVDLELRSIAGLGAAVVRENQDALMAAAWQQAGALRASAQALNAAHVSIEVGRSLARRVRRWSDGAVVQVTRALWPWIPSPASRDPFAVDVARSSLPRGLSSSSFARATRGRSTLGRAWSRRPLTTGKSAPSASATRTFFDATEPSASPATRAVLDFHLTRLPRGAWTHDDALDIDPTRFGSAEATARARALRERRLHQRRPAPDPAAAPVDVSRAHASIRAALDPEPHVGAALVARLPALAALLEGGSRLPRRLSITPRFTDPLCWDLVRLDPRFLLPGAETIAQDGVALLEADDTFVAAFLAGANHAMAYELLWREYPAPLAGTFFRRFWDTGPDGAEDTADMASSWTRPSLAANLSRLGAGARSVVVIRSELVRRYPDAHLYLVRGVWKDGAVAPEANEAQEPLMQGMLDARSLFLGFPLRTALLRGDRASSRRAPDEAGWFFAIEQPTSRPRFGLDTRRNRDITAPGASWRDLAWSHLLGAAPDLTHVNSRTPLPARLPRTLDGHTWGHNAAHMAAITWQPPFRLYLHADQLLPPEPRR